MPNNQKDSFDSTHLLVFLYRWRKVIISITAVGFAASILVSLLIRNKYKSTVILFPTTTSSVSKALLGDNRSSKDDILQFGEEEEAEQMLQILNSNVIRDSIIERYHLLEHYDIDPESETKQTDLYREYEGNITFQRTEFMSVKVEVLDTDREKAALMANDIAALYDTIISRIKKDRAQVGFQYVEQTYRTLEREIFKTQDSLNMLMKLGVMDYESQAERLNEALGKAILDGKTQAAQILREELNKLSKYGEAYMSLRDNLEFLRKQLSDVRIKYEMAKLDMEETLPDKFIVDKAFAAERKSYPVRWLIVVISTTATFILSILLIIAMESLNRIRKDTAHKITKE